MGMYKWQDMLEKYKYHESASPLPCHLVIRLQTAHLHSGEQGAAHP